MTTEFDLLKVVTSRLDEAGIDYMLTGSIAMSLYSAPRMTRDIDMVLHISSELVDKLVRIFKEDFYIDEHAVREAIARHDMFNIIHTESAVKFDFIVRKDEDYRLREFSRRQRIEMGDVPVTVVAAEDLILSKLVWAKDSESEFQMRDVEQILKAHEKLDHDYLHEWAKRLEVDGLLRKAQQNA